MAPINNPSMKRLKKELEEIEAGRDSNDESRTAIAAFPVEDNFFEWHFTMTGPSDSDYADGLYHGKIKFPTNYPFAPPDIIFTTKSGRFQVDTKICLTVTGFHPESWQPAWSTRTILLALRHHMAIDDNAVGSIKMSSSARRGLAKESQKGKCSVCGYCGEEMYNNVLRSRSCSASEDEDVGMEETETIMRIEEQKQKEKKKVEKSKLPWLLIGVVLIISIIIGSIFLADI